MMNIIMKYGDEKKMEVKIIGDGIQEKKHK